MVMGGYGWCGYVFGTTRSPGLVLQDTTKTPKVTKLRKNPVGIVSKIICNNSCPPKILERSDCLSSSSSSSSASSSAAALLLSPS